MHLEEIQTAPTYPSAIAPIAPFSRHSSLPIERENTYTKHIKCWASISEFLFLLCHEVQLVIHSFTFFTIHILHSLISHSLTLSFFPLHDYLLTLFRPPPSPNAFLLYLEHQSSLPAQLFAHFSNATEPSIISNLKFPSIIRLSSPSTYPQNHPTLNKQQPTDKQATFCHGASPVQSGHRRRGNSRTGLGCHAGASRDRLHHPGGRAGDQAPRRSRLLG